MLSKLRIPFVCALTLILTAAAASAQRTIHVPADQPTIQGGIDEADTGDTVLVAPGTYYENIDFKGKAITVTSSGGASVTTIDGQAKGPTVVFRNAEPRASVLSKFTVQHGGVFDYTEFVNGGIYLYNSTPTILDNTLTQNNCWTIYSFGSAPLIQGNEISATRDPDGACSFGGGAGVYISGDYFTDITRPTGLGMPAEITGNVIENNVESGLEDAGGNGGAGVAVWGGSPIIENNIIRNNASPGGSGGAINVENGGSVSIVQNLIYGNSAGCGGGALAFMGGENPVTKISILIASNTIVNNTDQGFPGGYSNCAAISQIYPSPDTYGMSNSDVSIVNNILSGSTSYPAVNCGWFETPSLSYQPTFEHNILYNAGGPFFGSYCIDVSKEDSNLSIDPRFVNAAANDYHLQATSPAIDAGDNSILSAIQIMSGRSLTTDFDGKPRVQGTVHTVCAVIDMGAYEYAGVVDGCSSTETLTSSLNPSAYGDTVEFKAVLTSTAGTPTGSVQFKDGSTVLGVETVSATGTSSYSTGALAIGTHAISAAYEPTGLFAAATASLSQVVTGTSTTTVLTCSATPSYIDSITMLTAMVTSTNGTPTGAISFTEGTATLGQVALTSGDASLNYTGTVVGAHTITATYVPTGAFAASAGTCNLTVIALPTTSVLTVNPTTSVFGSPVTLKATVSPVTRPGPSVPTGSVTFYNGSAAITTATLSNGIATFTTSALAGGTDSLTCIYGGSSIYAPSHCDAIGATITAAPSTLTLTSSANPSPALTAITLTAHLAANGQSAPAGEVILLTLGDSTMSLTTDAGGTASFTTSGLIPGTYTVAATFAGDPSLLTNSASLSERVNPNPTTTTLSVSPVPGEQGQPVTLSATVTATLGTAHPDGAVQFLDGPLVLGTVSVVASMGASSIATFSTTTLAVGQHTLAAIYIPATTSFLPSQATQQPFSVAFQGFTFTAAENPMTIEAGRTGTNVITIASLGGFTGLITMSCPAAMPPAATCRLSVSPVQLPPNGTVTTVLTITTEVTSGATFWTFLRSSHTNSEGMALASIFPLTILTLLGLRRRRKRFHALRISLALTSLAMLSSVLTACGQGQAVATYPGTYIVTLSASGTPQGSSSPTVHTLNLPLVITR